MHNFLAEVTADCTDILVVKPQKVMPNPGRKNQIVHTFEDGRNAVVAVSNTSIFEVELQWTYVSEADRSTIFELFHASAKANGSARSFYWYNPVDGYVYTVRFLTPLRTVYKPGSLRSVETVRLRVLGATPPLAPPTNVTATVEGSDIDITWTAASSVDGYNIYQSIDGGTWTKLNATTETGMTYTLTPTDPGEYNFRVTSVRGDKESAASAETLLLFGVEAFLDTTSALLYTFDNEKLYVLEGV